MPNFGKVDSFRKFNVNSLKLQEVLLLWMGVAGVASVHGQRRQQEKAENPSPL
jgi:hypothetical protein